MNRPYSEYAGERVAGLSGNEQLASSAAGALGSTLSPIESRISAGFTPGALDQYMNPYVDTVLGARKRAINEAYGQQMGALSRNQAATDAFRSGRTDVMRGQLSLNQIRALDEATGQTKADAFNAAMGAYQTGRAQDIAGVGAISGAEQQRIGALEATGANERQIQQARNDFAYGQFRERRDWDVNNLGTMISAIQGVEPTAGRTDTSVTKQTSKAGIGEILGGIATIAGAFMTGGASLLATGLGGVLASSGGGQMADMVGGAMSNQGFTPGSQTWDQLPAPGTT